MAVIDWWNGPLTLVVIFFALCLLLLTWSIAGVACRACHSSGTFFHCDTHTHARTRASECSRFWVMTREIYTMPAMATINHNTKETISWIFAQKLVPDKPLPIAYWITRLFTVWSNVHRPGKVWWSKFNWLFHCSTQGTKFPSCQCSPMCVLWHFLKSLQRKRKKEKADVMVSICLAAYCYWIQPFNHCCFWRETQSTSHCATVRQCPFCCCDSYGLKFRSNYPAFAIIQRRKWMSFGSGSAVLSTNITSKVTVLSVIAYSVGIIMVNNAISHHTFALPWFSKTGKTRRYKYIQENHRWPYAYSVYVACRGEVKKKDFFSHSLPASVRHRRMSTPCS